MSQSDQVYVLSYKQPKSLDLTDQGDIKMDEKNDEKELKAWKLKTNMMGDEGKLDLDIAKELLLISQKAKGLSETVGNFNSQNFSKGLITHEFMKDLKKTIKYQVSGKKRSERNYNAQ